MAPIERSYEDKVRERMGLLGSEYPNGDYPSATFEHDAGECVECDALRRLELENEDD